MLASMRLSLSYSQVSWALHKMGVGRRRSSVLFFKVWLEGFGTTLSGLGFRVQIQDLKLGLRS